MKNWKTSLSGVLTAAVALATYYGWIEEAAGVPITALGVALIAFFATDAK